MQLSTVIQKSVLQAFLQSTMIFRQIMSSYISNLMIIKIFIELNFFMLLLQDSDLSDDPEREQEKTKEAYSLKQKLSQQHKAKFTGMPSKGRQLPTAEETKRIAKIFSSKIS